MSPLFAIKSMLQILAVNSDKEETLGMQILGESCIFGHPIEDASSCNEVDWRIKFSYYSFVQDQDPVVVHDCVEPVGNGQYSAVFKLGTDGALDEVIGLQVNGSSGLV